MVKHFLVAATLLASISSVSAKTIWSDFSVTGLTGSDYELGDNSREVLSFEHTAGTTWGDSFMFFDRLTSSDGSVETYGEFTARIKLTEFDGVFKNLYVVPSMEMGPGNNYLLGLGTDINTSIFDFATLTLFARDNNDGDASMQATFVWGMPVGPLYYDGFIDLATGVDNTQFGDTEMQMNFTSQLKYDLGPMFQLENKLFVGIEYVFWNNKFGVDGIDERNMNLLVKMHF